MDLKNLLKQKTKSGNVNIVEKYYVFIGAAALSAEKRYKVNLVKILHEIPTIESKTVVLRKM